MSIERQTFTPMDFKKEERNLLDLLTEHLPEGFRYDAVRDFMCKIDFGAIKAKSTDKADIRIVIHNLGTGSKPDPGYNIKSKLGGGSYLINSNKNESNFIFKIEGINDSQMAHINTLDKFKKKFDYIKEVGGSWSFVEVAGATLSQNLLMLDLGMARIVGECLAQYYSGGGSSISDACSAKPSEVIELASLIGRSNNSVSLRLVNYAAEDKKITMPIEHVPDLSFLEYHYTNIFSPHN